MMSFRSFSLSCVTLLSCCAASALAGGTNAASRAQTQATHTEMRWQPMIFFVAKGAPNACGPGCSEWIAADGDFDSDTPQRLRDLLVSLNGSDLPIFFNSLGGINGQARAVGRILREHRMTAGVGRTIPEECRAATTADESCRHVMQSRRELKAQMRTADARCHSACVYAFIGASVRQVSAGSRMGIHSTKTDARAPREGAPTAEEVHLGRKRYVIEMGVDPGLVDAAAKIPSDRLHVMGRDEIARFGIETRDFYETPWMLDRDSSQRLILLKSVTQAKGAGSREYRTGAVRVWCEFTSWIVFSYRRELRSDEIGIASVIRLSAGGRDFVSEAREINGAIRASHVLTDLEFFRIAMSAPDVVITESFSPTRNAQGWSSAMKLSTTGLSELLGEWLNRCAEPRPVNMPNVGSGR